LDMVNLVIFAINVFAFRAVFPKYSWRYSSMCFLHMIINWIRWIIIYKTTIPAPMCLATRTSHIIAIFASCIHIFLFTHCLAIRIWALSISLRVSFVHLFWLIICFAWFKLYTSLTKMIFYFTF
jgi:hypothetical protein